MSILLSLKLMFTMILSKIICGTTSCVAFKSVTINFSALASFEETVIVIHPVEFVVYVVPLTITCLFPWSNPVVEFMKCSHRVCVLPTSALSSVATYLSRTYRDLMDMEDV